MDMKRSILLVDDKDEYREELVKDLKEAGYDAVGVATGQEGVNLVEVNPQRFQFAVIDQVLKEGDGNGIETARKLSNINRKLFILVFTNLFFEEKERAKYEYKALSAGAHRYIQRHEEEEPKTIVDFVEEIKELSELSEWIAGYHEQRSNVPSLLTQLNIGMDIIDRSHKLWYMSRTFRRITGYKENDLPKRPCSFWHGYNFFPCFGCLVERTMEDLQSHNEIFLSPLPYRQRGKLFYLNVWTESLRRKDGSLLVGQDKKPLAVMESVQDLTESKQIKDMPLEQRLDIIARSLQSHPVENRYMPTRQFRHVKIFKHVPGTKDEFALIATAGYKRKFLLGKRRKLRPEELYKKAVEKMRIERKGVYFKELGRKDPLDIDISSEKFALYPVMEGAEPIAWIEVSGRNCSEDSVSKIQLFAKEVLRAIISSKSREQTTLSGLIEFELAQVDNKLQTVTSAKDALRRLVEAACEYTDSFLAVVRYVEEEQAVLLPLSLDKFGDYEKLAEPSVSLQDSKSEFC